MLPSSTSPAENPSTGFFVRSETVSKQSRRDQDSGADRGEKGRRNRWGRPDPYP
jgi:hypothetical protein